MLSPPKVQRRLSRPKANKKRRHSAGLKSKPVGTNSARLTVTLCQSREWKRPITKMFSSVPLARFDARIIRVDSIVTSTKRSGIDISRVYRFQVPPFRTARLRSQLIIILSTIAAHRAIDLQFHTARHLLHNYDLNLIPMSLHAPARRRYSLPGESIAIRCRLKWRRGTSEPNRFILKK